MDRLSMRADIIRIRQRLRQRRLRMDDEGWVTIKGTHVLIDENGVAQSGGKLKGMTFSKAKSVKSKKKQAEGGSAGTPAAKPHKIAQGKDISETYKGKGDIKSIIKAQGFDGLPRVVSQDEFDKAVEASGIVAQRAYAASSQEVLDAYREALYGGEWYVECSEGGSVYGQGMYTAADYNGVLSDDVQEEVEGYADFYISNLKGDGHKNPVYYIETMTMDPSARIADHVTIDHEWFGMMTNNEGDKIRDDYKEEQYRQIGRDYGKDAETYARYQGGDPNVTLGMAADARKNFDFETKEYLKTKAQAIQTGAQKRVEEAKKQKKERSKELHKKYKDINAWAAAQGYDAVKVPFSGGDMTYTIILNRTKLIMLDGRQRKDAADAGGRITFRRGKGSFIEAVRNGKVIGYVMTNDYAKKG